MKSVILKLTCVLAAGLLANSARANDVLYSNLNSNPSHLYDALSAYFFEDGTFFGQGFSFMPSASEQLERIDLAVAVNEGTPSVIITLNADNSGLPGEVLETFHLTGVPTSTGCCALQTVTSTQTVDLFTGTRYWVVATPGASDTAGSWDVSNTGVNGPRAFESSSAGPFSIIGANDPPGAFDVIGNGVAVTPSVPEPGSLGVMGLGLGVLGVLSRRRRS